MNDLAMLEPPEDDEPERIQHDLRAEMAVVGALMLRPSVADDVAEVMRPEDHWRPAHQLIHEAVLSLLAQRKSVDAITVGEELARTGNLQRAGGQSYLHQCIAAVSVAENAGYHAKIVGEKAIMRALVEAGTRVVDLGRRDGYDDVDDIVNAAQAQVAAVAQRRIVGDEITNEQAVYAAVESLEHPLGPPTPWRDLSDAIIGWAPGWLYVVGARPGVGKTALGVGVLLDLAYRDQHPLMFSMEMPRDELYLRMLSNIGSVDGQRMLRRAMREDEERRLSKAAGTLSRLSLVVDDRSSLSLPQIHARIRAEQRKRPVSVVIVDYLTLIKPPDPKAQRVTQVDAIAQGLKNLARDLRVAVIALAQLNRAIEGRTSQVPTMSDLRESGGIEAAADVIMLMHRDSADDPTKLSIVLPKNRHGPQSRIELNFLGHLSRIEDREWAPRGVA